MATGLLIGGILGGVGSGIQAAETRRQQARQRRRQRKAIQQAREFTGGTTVSRRGIPDEDIIPGTAVTNEFLEQHGGVPFGLATFQDPTTGERRFGGRVEEILADPLLVQARSFLEGTFENAADSPLAQDFVKGIRAAQAARGTGFGGSAIGTEAGGLAAFSQRLRQDLLPQAMAFGTLGENLRQGILGFEAPLRVAAATGGSGLGSGNLGGPGILSSILSGAASGAAGGFSLQREFAGPRTGGATTLTGGGTAAQLGDESSSIDQLIARLNQRERDRLADQLAFRQGRI
jgi:hypothetical protein